MTRVEYGDGVNNDEMYTLMGRLLNPEQPCLGSASFPPATCVARNKILYANVVYPMADIYHDP